MLKRLVDILLAVVLILLCAVPFMILLLAMALRRDLPIFFISERMQSPTRQFSLIKLRTMRAPTANETNTGVSGGDKRHRVTPLGAALRRYRLDEVPQLWNVLRGELSFVGPRPPLRSYVERFPQLYARVLRNRPGITGLASIIFHHHEARLLADARTAPETDEIYVRRCIPRKARLDMIYQRNQSLRLDLYILYLTAAKLIPLPGRRARRIRHG